MFEEFEGDVEACQALYNSYLFRVMAIGGKKLKEGEEKKTQYNGDLLDLMKLLLSYLRLMRYVRRIYFQYLLI